MRWIFIAFLGIVAFTAVGAYAVWTFSPQHESRADERARAHAYAAQVAVFADSDTFTVSRVAPRVWTVQAGTCYTIDLDRFAARIGDDTPLEGLFPSPCPD